VKKAIVLALMGVSAVVCLAQSSRFPPINLYTGDPTGNACTGNIIQQSSTTGKLYTCQGGTMQAGSGSGSVSGQTAGKIPLATGATTIGSPSHLDDGVTTSGVITSSEPFVTTGSLSGTTMMASDAPLLDIRSPAFGGCSGVIDTCLQNAYDALPSFGGEIMLVCPQPTPCRWQNPTLFNWGSKVGAVTFYINGYISLGTTLKIPYNKYINIIGRSGFAGVSFQSAGQLAGLIVDNLKGVLGTAVTIADGDNVSRTITPSTMTGIYPGMAITITGVLNCPTATLSRTANTATATFSSACHIPPGVSLCVSGASDSTFNGCYSSATSQFLAVKADYYTNSLSWLNSGADTSGVTGATVQGFNEDTYENVEVTSTTATTFTAIFNRSHLATDRWGVVAFEDASNGVTGLRKDIVVNDNGGTPIWLQGTYLTSYENVQAGTSSGCTASPSTTVFNPPVDIGQSSFIYFNHSTFTTGCEPWTIHMGQSYNTGYAGSGPIYLNNVNLYGGGVKTDHGGSGVFWNQGICDQCPRAAITFDPTTTTYWSGVEEQFLINTVLAQDNPHGLTSYWIYQMYPWQFGPSVGQSQVKLTSGSFSGGTYNSYYSGQTLDGLVSGEIVGGQAGLGPTVIPYSPLPVTNTNPSWSGPSCSNVTSTAPAPDGSLTAGTITGAAGTSLAIGNNTTVWPWTPAVGDQILFGGWFSGAASGMFIDNNGSTHYDIPGGYGSSGGLQQVNTLQYDTQVTTWHPVVGYAAVSRADGSTNQTLRLNITCQGGLNSTYWQPWYMIIPASAGYSVAEVQRWRLQLMHGVVPSGLIPAGTLAMNSNAKLSWGSQTYLSSSPQVATVTAVSITSNVLTVTAANSFQVGQTVNFGNMITNYFLDYQPVVVTSATSSSFTAAYTHANMSSAEASGSVSGGVLTTNGPINGPSANFTGTVAAASTMLGWTDVRAYGVSTSNTATQNQTAFAAVASAVNASTAPAYIWVPSGTYNVLSTGGTALGAYTTPITFHCQDRNSTILNLSGTGTAISLAPSTTYGSATTNWVPVVFENCYLTGGTSLTEGIFVGSNNISAKISHNYFWNFGGTSMNAIHTDGISETQVLDNIYIRNDHVLGKFAYSSSVATSVYTYLEALDNVVICTVSTTDANSIACGSGIASDGYLEASRNLMSGPIPDYRCGSQANAQCSISNSNLECFGDPCIMFGTPGSSSAETTNNLMVHDMQVYLNSGTIHVVGPAQSQSKLATSTINNLRLRTGSSQGTVSVPMVAQNNLTGQTGNLYYGNTGWTSNNTTGSNIDAWSTIGGSGTGGYVAAPTVTCTTGQYSADATHIYLCYGTNAWNQVTATAYTNPYQTQDTFTGTAGTLVTAHTDNNSHTWAQYNSISGDPSCGSATLTGSNSATCPGLIGNYFDAINSLAPSSADYVTSGTFAVTGSATAQLFARSSAVARTNYLAAYANAGAGTTSLYKCVAGTCTQMGSSVSGVWSAGTPHVFALSVSGSATTTVIVTLDGVTKISQTDSSSPITAAGQAGFVISGAASNTISSFTVQ
jgi:hypothetical protein